MDIIAILFVGIAFGIISAYAMDAFMRAVSTAYSSRVDMILALGSFFSGNVKNAQKLGSTIHSIAGAIFGAIYLLIIHQLDALIFPYALFLGIGFGFFHGLIVSYGLMFLISERHPLPEYRKVTLEVGLLHLVGHLIFGAVTGLLGGLLGLMLA